MAISTMLLVFLSFVGFTYVAKQYIYKEIVEQAINDNQVIGETVLNLLKMGEFQGDVVSSLQNTCDNVQLPNSGYLCVADTKGDIVAFPGLKKNQKMNMNERILSDVDGKKSAFKFSQLKDNQSFKGLLHGNNDESEIIVSIPIESEGLRIMVHQNNTAIMERANEYTKPLFVFGLVIAVFLGTLVYFSTNKLVVNYEHEIELKNNKLEGALDKITVQHNEIVEQQENIKQSIRYAREIQRAALPSENLFTEQFTNHFIFFKPRDVVSGDFYWLNSVDNQIIVAAADSTGHGVPGAFVSMLGISMLNEIVHRGGISHACQILDKLRDRIKHALSQTGADNEQKDGMDIALCVIDFDKKQLQFAGANNPLYVIRKNELIELKGDRQPIGIHLRERPFTNHEMELRTGDMLYIFSDGFSDQFGGEKGRKFLSKKFKKLLLDIHSKDTTQQKQTLESTFNNWKGKLSQVDDVLVMGIQI